MNFNPVDVHKHLKGADYPASGEGPASIAESNGGSDALVERLRNLSDGGFSGPDKATAALKRS
jgi:hypothetical protein